MTILTDDEIEKCLPESDLSEPMFAPYRRLEALILSKLAAQNSEGVSNALDWADGMGPPIHGCVTDGYFSMLKIVARALRAETAKRIEAEAEVAANIYIEGMVHASESKRLELLEAAEAIDSQEVPPDADWKKFEKAIARNREAK